VANLNWFNLCAAAERAALYLNRHCDASEGRNLSDTRDWRLAGMLNKVPEVTLFFWIIKIMATTVGETAADLTCPLQPYQS